MKILEQLWYDGLRPSESLSTTDKLYRERLDLVVENEEKLLSMLPDEIKEAYENFSDSRVDLLVTERAKIFITGFRLGAKIMLEIMEQEEAAKK